MKKRILIVEDEAPISNLIQLNLSVANYDTKQVFNGTDAIKAVEQEQFDLVLLDIMIPELDGFQVLEHIRPHGVPVIFLTARDNVLDKVHGLRSGAEDYITKPFQAIELLARIETVLRRFGKGDDILSFKDITIHLKEHYVKKHGSLIELTVKEFELLCTLVQNVNIAFTREALLERIWSYDFIGGTRTVDMHIRSLRKKLDLNDDIKTVYKVGYRLEN